MEDHLPRTHEPVAARRSYNKFFVAGCGMKQGSGLVEPVVDRTVNVPPEPRFVVDLEPWAEVFFRNLGDSFRAPEPGLKLSSPPAAFWEDVFVAPAPGMTATVTQSPALPRDVIAPPPVVQAALIQRLGDINIGRAQVVSPAPGLPLTEQRTPSAMNTDALGASGPAVVPPPPSVEATGTTNGGRLIALGIHPSTPTAPLAVPPGNRTGIFAA